MADSSLSRDTPGRRRRSKRPDPARVRRRRLRTLYFSLAAVWGFVIGSASLLGGLYLVGHPVRMGAGVASTFLAAGLLAVAGGAVASQAYRQATRH